MIYDLSNKLSSFHMFPVLLYEIHIKKGTLGILSRFLNALFDYGFQFIARLTNAVTYVTRCCPETFNEVREAFEVLRVCIRCALHQLKLIM